MYCFTSKCKNKDALAIWKVIQNGLSKDVTIKSIKERLPYAVNYINADEISFSATTRNAGEPEIIQFEDFQHVIADLKKLDAFNTSIAKECFTGTKIYKKRSPFFALLLSSGVIETINN